MAELNRLTVARQLEPLGLRRTLIAVRREDRYNVSRITRIAETVELTPVGSFTSDHVPQIGRVGIPDPQLGISWTASMPFYGKWFDHIAETDVGYHLRRNISSLSQQRMLEQVSRDEQYALIGSYYSVFRTIMAAKRRIPLVLIDDVFLPLISFPVVLPRIDDPDLGQMLHDVLFRMLRPDSPTATGQITDAPDVAGIEVEEL